MKVLHFFKTYCPESKGSVEQFIYQLAEGGREHGILADVLYLSERGAARNEPVGQHLAHRSRLDLHAGASGFSFSAFKDFTDLASQADLVHYHFPWPYMELVHFASRLNKPAVVTYHADIIERDTLLKLYQPLMNRFLGSVDRIVASSPDYVASSEVLQRFADKVSVIPFGLDEATYPTPDASRLEHWRQQVGPRFFLFVGALRDYKGLDYLIEAARQADLPVVIVGQGPLEQELRAKAQAIGAHTVRFVGGLDDQDKVALLQLCEGFVFPSHLRSEAFGIALLEAAMYGKPMISCDIGSGMSYINEHGKTGLVIPPRNVQQLAEAMQKIWNDPAWAGELGRGARERFEWLFGAERMIGQYAELYLDLVAVRL
ncbi:glycosyltransferase family 4 protein [Pseudomonas fulva]|nr:glycosyltransferase family 4 protein [Pseudomonas fulva]MBF8780874.1 glycosyltransferase family 4 protein [Pseudomonas fulva]